MAEAAQRPSSPAPHDLILLLPRGTSDCHHEFSPRSPASGAAPRWASHMPATRADEAAVRPADQLHLEDNTNAPSIFHTP